MVSNLNDILFFYTNILLLSKFIHIPFFSNSSLSMSIICSISRSVLAKITLSSTNYCFSSLYIMIYSIIVVFFLPFQHLLPILMHRSSLNILMIFLHLVYLFLVLYDLYFLFFLHLCMFLCFLAVSSVGVTITDMSAAFLEMFL